MLYELDDLKSINLDTYYAVPSRFRQAREWLDKNLERCKASFDPAKCCNIQAHNDRAFHQLYRLEHLQGIYIYKNDKGWYADMVLSDGDDVVVSGNAVADPKKTRHEAQQTAEFLIHLLLAHEHNLVKDCRTIDRFNWKCIWQAILHGAKATQRNAATYPVRTLMVMDGVDDGQNDHTFMLHIDECISTEWLDAGIDELASRRTNDDDDFAVMAINDGKAGVALLGCDDVSACFSAFIDCTDVDGRRVIYLRASSIEGHDDEAHQRVKDIIDDMAEHHAAFRVNH